MSEPGDRSSVALAVAVAVVCAGGACREGTPRDAGTDVSSGDAVDAATGPAIAAAAEQARNAIDAYVEAVNAMDLDSAGTFYSDSPDFRWIEDGEVRYRSAQESRESLAELGAMASATELTVSDLSVTGLSADIAIAACHFTQTVQVAEGGPGFSFSGAMSIVLRREGGRWLFLAGHTSSARSRTDGTAGSEQAARGQDRHAIRAAIQRVRP